MKKKTAIRIFLSLLITLYAMGVITDAYQDLDVLLLIFIGVLIFSLVSTAARFIPIKEILTKL